MAQLIVQLRGKVNHRRMNAMKQELLARLKRAPRRDRLAMYHRGVKNILDACVRVTVG